MVCVEGAALCVVRDATNAAHGETTATFNMAGDCTVSELFQEVGKRMQYHHDSFELILQAGKEMVILNTIKAQTIETAGLKVAPGEKNQLLLLELKGKPLQRMTDLPTEEELRLGASASPTAGGDFATPPAPPPPPSTSTTADCTYSATTIVRHDTGYVGLVNQAMTCYLNSLLQALYMTPEFRNALYNWEFDGGQSDESKSIPYQLQKLFLNLQTSQRSAVETTELTRSFGWDSSEAWQQHDIQELCRVMFDALEQKFKNTEQSDLINRLYEGKMIDYVKCLECCTEKSREDTFLDIPLPVRPFGSSVAYGSVEEALRAFVQPETLDGNNQYLCERCGRKCDAHKGLKFSKFPYLLTLHLKRFDFDYNTLHRIKLNDKVTFPEKLNLNGFVTDATCGLSGGVAENVADETLVKCDDSSTTDSGSALDDEGCQPIDSMPVANHDNHNTDFQEDDEGIDMSNQQEAEKNRNNVPETGPYLYELFSIMIHSGSATGGHYYAYIKDLRQGEWLCFNDQSVTRITYEDIRKTYGGGPLRGYYSGAYSSSTNAYMLMYRQVDPARNTCAITEDEFPPHLLALRRRMEEQKDREQKMKEREQDMCKLKLYCHHPQQKLVTEAKLYISNDSTLQQTVVEAYRRLNLENVVPLDRCRLVSYDRLKGNIECSFEGKDDETISEIFRNAKYPADPARCCEFLLDIRDENETFQVYKPGNINTKVLILKLECEEVDGPLLVQGNLNQTMAEYKQVIARRIKAAPDSLYLVLEKYSNEPRMLYTDEATLKSEGFYGSNKIYVASVTDPEDRHTVLEKMRKVIEKFKHIITLHVTLPCVDKDVLEKHNIPALEQQNELCPATSKPQSRGASPSDRQDRQEREPSPQPSADTEDECMGPDQSASEDSSLTDSERTIVGEAPGDCLTQLSASNSPVGSEHNVSSPENEAGDLCNCKTPIYKDKVKVISALHQDDSWDVDEDDEPSRCTSYYLKATPYTETHSTGHQRMLKVMVDKRMTLRALKHRLEPHVGVSSDHFKVFRPHNGQSEMECSRLNESLGIYRDEERLTVKLGRALRKGECSGNVYLLALNGTETVKFLCEWIVAKGAPVSQVKRELLDELKRKSLADIPYSRCRLRKKNWKNPTKPLLEGTHLDDDFISNWELFVQELPYDEPVTSATQKLIFVRQWCPSTLELKPFDEVVLDTPNVSEFKEKISALSSIPVENIDIAKGTGSFPCVEVSVLGIHSDLDWNPQTKQLDSWPLNLYDDGHVMIYRDNREKIKQLSVEEKKEIVSREYRGNRGNRDGASSSSSSVFSYSPRKERALKIYLDTTPSSRQDELDVD